MSENDQKIAKILSAQQWDPGANNPLLACESPIERFFVAAMLVDGWMPLPEWLCVYLGAQFAAGETAWSLEHAVTVAMADAGTGSIACLQAPVRLPEFSVRIDVAVLRRGGPPIAVELDGAAFHEANDAQRVRDRSRDRELVAAGWTTMRFMGSELHRDAHACARDLRRVVGGFSAEERRQRWLAAGEAPGLAKAGHDAAAAVIAAEASGEWSLRKESRR